MNAPNVRKKQTYKCHTLLPPDLSIVFEHLVCKGHLLFIAGWEKADLSIEGSVVNCILGRKSERRSAAMERKECLPYEPYRPVHERCRHRAKSQIYKSCHRIYLRRNKNQKRKIRMT